MYKSQSLEDFLAELSSRSPTPGGGTAAALAAAMGTSLVEMVANVVGSRDALEKERLAPFVSYCSTSRAEFLVMMDRDSAAFDGYMTAVRMLRTTDEEKAVRRTAMQLALERSTRAPLDLARGVCSFVEMMVTSFPNTPKDIASDLYVGASMLDAGFSGAIANVYVNLSYLGDRSFAENARLELGTYQERVRVLQTFKNDVGCLLSIGQAHERG